VKQNTKIISKLFQNNCISHSTALDVEVAQEEWRECDEFLVRRVDGS